MSSENNQLSRNYSSGCEALATQLLDWGIHHSFGVAGVGLLELLHFFTSSNDTTIRENPDELEFFTLNEYLAGFAPVGHYLSSGAIAMGIATAGAAEKLLGSGMTDAHMRRLPAVYLLQLNALDSKDCELMHDVSPRGMNIVNALTGEFGDDVLILDSIKQLPILLGKMSQILAENRPCIFAFHPDVLQQPIKMSLINRPTPSNQTDTTQLMRLQQALIHRDEAGRVLIYVCSEAAHHFTPSSKIAELSSMLGAEVICSVNGLNAVKKDFPMHVGNTEQYFHAENEAHIFERLTKNDILICLGFDGCEDNIGRDALNVGQAWLLSQHVETQAYGLIDGSYRHRFKHQYEHIKGSIEQNLTSLLGLLDKNERQTKSETSCLNKQKRPVLKTALRDNCIDLCAFYEAMNALWCPDTFIYEDIGVSLRDRPLILPVGHENIKIFSSIHAVGLAALGAGIGITIGAKVAKPSRDVILFCGDGAWRYWAGSMPDISELGLVVFLLNNQCFGLIKRRIEQRTGDIEQALAHTNLKNLDFCAIAKASAWHAEKILPDLSNLADVYKKAIAQKNRSTLIELPIDPNFSLAFERN